MTLSQRDRRALVLLAAAMGVMGVLYYVSGNSSGNITAASSNTSQNNIGLAQQRLVRMRQIAATLPAREAAMKQVSADLTDRERGVIQAETAAQAQAALLETARRIGKNDDIDVRGGDFGAPKTFGDYGLVYTTITFECHIEQLVNFLADLSHEPQLIVPSEERIAAGNAKDKTMNIRMVLAGVVPKKLVPEKKGLAAF
ncbi:MAG TPA: GspMb/PilO family protein [Bryobacteraceae bacterium]|nr:GspMb/PilO family protein [Bryobacteraceae bacterium]